MRVEHLVTFGVNRAAKNLPQHFHGPFLLSGTIAAGILICTSTTQDLNRVAAIRTEYHPTFTRQNDVLQFAGIFRQHLPVVPGIRDYRYKSLRVEIGNQAAEGFNFMLALTHTHHAVFGSRNAGADKIGLAVGVVIAGVQQRWNTVGPFKAQQMPTARLHGVL